jgi:hypothetical protein
MATPPWMLGEAQRLSRGDRSRLPLCSLSLNCWTHNGTFHANGTNWPCYSSVEVLPGRMVQLPPLHRFEAVDDDVPRPLPAGAWRQHGMPYDFESCPFMLRNYACHEFDGERAVDLVRRRYEPHFCRLRAFDPREFLERMRGKRLIFIGDSLNRQFFISIACQLAAHVGAAAYTYQIWNRVSDYIDQQEAVDPDGSQCTEWYRGHCFFTMTRVVFTSHDFTMMFVYQKRWDMPVWLQLMARLRPVESDVMVHSVGVFYAGDLVLQKHDMLAMVEWLEVTEYPGTIFFREMSPSHFSDHESGLYQQAVTNVTCRAFNADKGYRYNWKDILYILGKCRYGLGVGEGGKAKKEVGRCARLHALPVFDVAQTQHDAHFGSFAAKPDALRRQRDCVHWCLPSAAVDTWTAVLFNFLTNKWHPDWFDFHHRRNPYTSQWGLMVGPDPDATAAVEADAEGKDDSSASRLRS